MSGAEPAIHVYYADQRDLAGEHVASFLTDSDRQRGEEATHPRRRAEFLAGRALLRYALEQFTGRAASSHELRTAPEGKPECANGPAISVSHSGAIVVCAVAGVAVGVDVETPKTRTVAAVKLAEQNFTAAETSWVAGDPDDRFRMLWVLKESYLKLLGVGLAGGLRSLECAIAPPWIETRVAAGVAQPRVALYSAHGSTYLGVAWRGEPQRIAIVRWAPTRAADRVGPFEQIAATRE